MKISVELQPILKNKTGIGWYTYNILKEINKFKISVNGEVFNFLGKNELGHILNDIDLREYEINKILPYSIYRRIWSVLPIKYNWLFKRETDIYHFFNYIVPPKIDGKVITTVYDMVYKRFPETMEKATFDRLDKELQRSVERANRIITISESSKKEIIEYLNVEENKIHIVPPGVDIEEFSKEHTVEEMLNVRNKYNLPEEYILFLGTIEPRKNIETIIEAFNIYKNEKNGDTKLVLAGRKGWSFESVFQKISEYELESEVILTDYLDEEDKILLYKMSKVFVFPSLYEGFGMPVLEAMAAGVPVITSNISSLPEVAGDAAILVEPLDYKRLANEMANLLSNEEYRTELIKKGKQQAVKFTWTSAAEKLYDVYSELMKK